MEQPPPPKTQTLVLLTAGFLESFWEIQIQEAHAENQNWRSQKYYIRKGYTYINNTSLIFQTSYAHIQYLHSMGFLTGRF